MIKRVLWPLAPLPGESLMGFVGRVAAHNVIDDTLSITAQAGQRFGHRTSLVYSPDADLETLATALRVDVTEIKARAHPPLGDGGSDFFGLKIPFYHLETKVRRFSPASLGKAAYHRAIWEYRPIPFCAESWEYLTDACSLCGAVQRWYHAQGPDRCDACGANLADSSANTVPEASRDILAFVAGLADPVEARRVDAMRQVPDLLAHLKPEAVLELILHVGYLAAPDFCKGRRDDAWRRSPAAQAEMLRASAELVVGWPHKPVQLLVDRFNAEANNGSSGIMRNTGPFFKSSSVACLSSEVRQELKVLVPSLNAFAQLETVTQKTAAPITVRRASAISGLETQELTHYRRSGWLRSILFTNDADTITAGFDEAEVGWLARAIRSRRSMSSVAMGLGISRHGVEQLICLRFITPIDHPIFKARYNQPNFGGADVDSFFDRLRAAALPSLSGVPLRQAVRAIPGPKPWGPIIASMLDGRLPFGQASDDRLISSATVSEKSLLFVQSLRFDKLVYPDYVFDELVSKRDAFEALNLRPSDGRFLAPGIVEAATTSDYRTVRLEFVERMAREFVPTSELMARSRLTADQVRTLLSSAGLRPITGFGWPRWPAEAAIFGSG